MANKQLFKSAKKTNNRIPNTVNSHGTLAFSHTPKHHLAQLACTGTFNNTVYLSGQSQLDQLKMLLSQVEPEFIAKLAIYSRQSAYMKDMPPMLLTYLLNNKDLFTATFNKVVDSPKILRNFVQIIRSGETGRKSLGTLPKRLVANKLNSYSPESLLKASIGQNPSLKDLIRLSHPKPVSKERSNLYSYFINRPYELNKLPKNLIDLQSFKNSETSELPDVPFEMLTSFPLTDTQWKKLATRLTWQQLRMNLATLNRHNVFSDQSLTDLLADKLASEEEVLKSKVFPYQLFMAYRHGNSSEKKLPKKILFAIETAMEFATSNVETFDCNHVVIAPDVSGSMSSPITGWRQGGTSAATCLEVAAIITSAVLRRNENALVLPFDTKIHKNILNSDDSILQNADVLSSIRGGGTNCSLPLKYVNNNSHKVDLMILVSDNESWCDNVDSNTGVMREWRILKESNPQAKLVNIDLTPSRTSQSYPKDDILNIGGYSDNLFKIVNSFLSNKKDKDYWVSEIEKIEL